MISLSTTAWIFIVAGLVAITLIALVTTQALKHRRRRQSTTPEAFLDKWKELQKLCPNKDSWPDAIRAADDILGDALRKKRFRGSNTGERLTKAQRQLTNNEGAWFGHKLRSKIDSNTSTKLQEKDVKLALAGIRQALRDLGVLKNDK